MSQDPRNRILGVEVQHIFVTAIETRISDEADRARAFLQSIGFDLESRSNKVALLARVNVRDAILNAPDEVQQVHVPADLAPKPLQVHTAKFGCRRACRVELCRSKSGAFPKGFLQNTVDVDLRRSGFLRMVNLC